MISGADTDDHAENYSLHEFHYASYGLGVIFQEGPARDGFIDAYSCLRPLIGRAATTFSDEFAYVVPGFSAPPRAPPSAARGAELSRARQIRLGRSRRSVIRQSCLPPLPVPHHRAGFGPAARCWRSGGGRCPAGGGGRCSPAGFSPVSPVHHHQLRAVNPGAQRACPRTRVGPGPVHIRQVPIRDGMNAREFFSRQGARLPCAWEAVNSGPFV